MGLDMYMFHVQKLNDDEILSLSGKHTKEIGREYVYMSKGDFDDDPDMYSDLIPYVSQINVIARSFDWKRCWKEHGIDEGDEVCARMYGCGIASYSFVSGKQIQLNEEQYESYCYDHDDPVYVWKSKEVAYWRKHYELDEYLQKIRIECRKDELRVQGRTPTKEEVWSWKTENCGYYLLSYTEKQRLGEFLKKELKKGENMHCDSYEPEWFNLINDESSALFYHAWW